MTVQLYRKLTSFCPCHVVVRSVSDKNLACCVKLLNVLLLCDRVAHLMEEKAFKLGYGKFSAMQEQAKQQQSSALQHVNMSFLPRGQKVKHLVSEFGRYMRLGFYHLVTTKLMSTRFYTTCPKVRG